MKVHVKLVLVVALDNAMLHASIEQMVCDAGVAIYLLRETEDHRVTRKMEILVTVTRYMAVHGKANRTNVADNTINHQLESYTIVSCTRECIGQRCGLGDIGLAIDNISIQKHFAQNHHLAISIWPWIGEIIIEAIINITK